MKRARKVCAHIGCPELTQGRDSYCREHLKQYKKKHDAKRPNATQRGYDAEWRRIRAHFLKYHPYCFICGGAADQVHHVIPLKKGGTHAHDNLRAVCTTCHNKHLDAGFPTRRRGAR